ncbi:MAG: SH3 domain-containing protein [Roseburia sp.]|nr:SH3 domain-containing protein [Roseburia sp.]
MKARRVLLLMAVLTAMTVSVCGCGQKDETPENGTEIAAITDTEQPTEAIPEETEDTEELQIEAAVTDTEEIATSQPDSSVKEMSATKYAKNTVNVRKGPSADTEKIGSLSANQKVTVTGQAENGWYRIDYNGEAGYVSDKYLVDEKVTTASGNSNGGKTNNTGAAGNSGGEAPAQGNGGTVTAGNTADPGNDNGSAADSGSTSAGNTGNTGTGGNSDAGNTGNIGNTGTGSDNTSGSQSEYENSSSGQTYYGEDAKWLIESGLIEAGGGVVNEDGSVTINP